MSGTGLQPGIYEGMPFDDYAALEAMNHSRLSWLMDESPLFYIGMLGTPEDAEKPALKFGRATHCAVCEPERFRAEYVVEPDPESFINPKTGEPYASPRATKIWKEANQLLIDDGKIPLKADEYVLAVSIAAAFENHPLIGKLIKEQTGAETTLLWERDGILCKCRLDLHGPGWLLDFKTTRNFNGFTPWEVEKWKLHRQLAWYRSGTIACGLDCPVAFLAVASNQIPDVAEFNMQLGALDVGRAENDRGWAEYLKCKRTGKWPGRYDPETVHPADLSDRRYDQLMEAGLV